MIPKLSLPSEAYFGASDRGEILVERVKKLRSHGFEAIDYSGFIDTENVLFTCSEEEFKERLCELARVCCENGVEIFQAHGPWRYPPRDLEEADREERFEKMSRSIRGCAILGCPRLVIHPIMPFGVSSVPEQEPARMREMNLEFFSRLVKVAEEYGVIICLENMPFKDFSLSLPAEILSLVKEIDSPNMRVCLDTGHSVIFEDPADSVRLIGKEYLAALHLHDNSGKRDEHKAPYEGKIDWQKLCAALREIGYDGVLNFETYAKGKYPPEIREYMRIGFFKIVDSIRDIYISL